MEDATTPTLRERRPRGDELQSAALRTSNYSVGATQRAAEASTRHPDEIYTAPRARLTPEEEREVAAAYRIIQTFRLPIHATGPKRRRRNGRPTAADYFGTRDEKPHQQTGTTHAETQPESPYNEESSDERTRSQRNWLNTGPLTPTTEGWSVVLEQQNPVSEERLGQGMMSHFPVDYATRRDEAAILHTDPAVPGARAEATVEAEFEEPMAAAATTSISMSGKKKKVRGKKKGGQQSRLSQNARKRYRRNLAALAQQNPTRAIREGGNAGVSEEGPGAPSRNSSRAQVETWEGAGRRHGTDTDGYDTPVATSVARLTHNHEPSDQHSPSQESIVANDRRRSPIEETPQCHDPQSTSTGASRQGSAPCEGTMGQTPEDYATRRDEAVTVNTYSAVPEARDEVTAEVEFEESRDGGTGCDWGTEHEDGNGDSSGSSGGSGGSGSGGSDDCGGSCSRGGDADSGCGGGGERGGSCSRGGDDDNGGVGVESGLRGSGSESADASGGHIVKISEDKGHGGDLFRCLEHQRVAAIAEEQEPPTRQRSAPGEGMMGQTPEDCATRRDEAVSVHTNPAAPGARDEATAEVEFEESVAAAATTSISMSGKKKKVRGKKKGGQQSRLTRHARKRYRKNLDKTKVAVDSS